MTSLMIREVQDDDFAVIAAGLTACGKPTTPDQARRNSKGWARRRDGTEYVVIKSGAIVGTAGISPSRHMKGAVSIGAQFFDDTRSVDLYRVVLGKARESGAVVATCTIAADDEGERAVWEQLGAEFSDAGRGRLYPTLSLVDC